MALRRMSKSDRACAAVSEACAGSTEAVRSVKVQAIAAFSRSIRHTVEGEDAALDNVHSPEVENG